MVQVLSDVKTGRASGPSDVSLELFAASREVGMQAMAEIFQIVLDGFGMPVEWDLSILVSICKVKGDIRNLSCYSAVNLLEHGMKVVMTVNEMQFGFMPEGGAFDTVFILRWLQEGYHDRQTPLF